MDGMNNKETNTMTLQHELGQFCGTMEYHRYSRKLVLTDGARYLAERAGCFWLVSIVDSILPQVRNESFLSVRMIKNPNASAIVEITDGNEKPIFRQAIEFTDFPMNEIQLFVQESDQFWVMMLTTEY